MPVYLAKAGSTAIAYLTRASHQKIQKHIRACVLGSGKGQADVSLLPMIAFDIISQRQDFEGLHEKSKSIFSCILVHFGLLLH